jgi:hypothetical protein
MFVLVMSSNDHFKCMYTNVYMQAGVFKCGAQVRNHCVCVILLFIWSVILSEVLSSV